MNETYLTLFDLQSKYGFKAGNIIMQQRIAIALAREVLVGVKNGVTSQEWSIAKVATVIDATLAALLEAE